MPSTPESMPGEGPTGTRREALLGDAARLFAERGFHGTSMRDIAAAGGIRPASLYSHFAGKEQILVELVERYTDALVPRLREVADRPVDGATRFAELLVAAVEVAEAHRHEFLTLSNDWNHIRRTPELAVLVQRRDTSTAIWREVLAAGRADGSLRGDVDTATVLWLVFASITGMVDDRYRGTDEPVRAPIAGLVTVMLEGLRPPPHL